MTGRVFLDIIFVVVVALLLSVSNGHANELQSPTFYNYASGSFSNQFASATFGFFRTLNDAEEDAYYQALTHALMYADNGDAVEWFQGKASGTATPVYTWPVNNGYCRRLHVQTFAYERQRTQTATACSSGDTWRWVRSEN